MDFQLIARDLLSKIFHKYAPVVYENHLPNFIKVINKDTIRKVYAAYSIEGDFIEMVCCYLIENPHPLIVPIYKFEGNFEDNWCHYSYDMKLLTPISEEEACIVNNARNDTNNFGISALSRFTNRRLVTFLQKVLVDGIYWDLHGGNVMKDQDGNYLLIDLEGLNPASRFADSVRDWAKSRNVQGNLNG